MSRFLHNAPAEPTETREAPDNVYDVIEEEKKRFATSRPEKREQTAKPKKTKREIDQEKRRRVASWVVCIGLLLVIVVIIFSQIMPDTKVLQLPADAVTGAVSPVQSFFSSITSFVRDELYKLSLRGNIERHYNEAVSENDRLTYENMAYQAQIAELLPYFSMWELNETFAQYKPLICQVTGKTDNSAFFATFTIDKGSRDGVKAGQAVVTLEGLVGKVESVSSHSAVVRSIVDVSSSIGATINGPTGDFGIVKGKLGENGEPLCKIEYTSDSNLPRPGDVVETSNIGAAFPKGIVIGTVRESPRQFEGNKSYITIDPAVNFSSISSVAVFISGEIQAADIPEYQNSLAYGPDSFVATPTALPETVPELPGSSNFYSEPTPSPDDDEEDDVDDEYQLPVIPDIPPVQAPDGQYGIADYGDDGTAGFTVEDD